MSQDARIDDFASDTGLTGGSPHQTGVPAFPLPPMYPESVTQYASAQPALPRIVTDPRGRQMQTASPSGRRSPNTQWSALGRTSPRAAGVRKKKGVDPAIAALQTQLSRTTGEIGERLGVASESVDQAHTTAQAALHHAQAAQAESAQMRSMIDETLRAHFAQTSVDTQSKLDAVAATLAQQLVHATESTQKTLAEKHTAEVERLRLELAEAREHSVKAMHRAQEMQTHATGTTQADVGALRAQVETEVATRVAGEVKTATALETILHKIQNSEQKTDLLQQEMQEQKKGIEDMGEKLNAVLAEMQAVSLQVDLLSGGDMSFGPDTTEGAHWTLQDQKMDEKPAPPNTPLQPKNVIVSAAGTNPQIGQSAAFPTFGTIVPPSVPLFAGNAVGSSSTPPLQEKKNSPFGFEFPPVSASAQVQNPSISLFHNSGNQNPPAQNKSFPNVSWRPKEPQVFSGKNSEDVHSWTEVVSHYFMFMQGTPQQEVAYAATLLRANAHDWFMAYLRKNQGRYPRDWATMSAALVDRFGSRLRDRQALAELMVMRQNRRNVREFAADFENCVGKLTSSDENTLMQMFLWALDRDLAEKVALAHPKSLQSAISIAEDLELAVRFAHRPVVKGGAAASSTGTGTQANTGGRQSTQWRGGRRGAGRWGRGGGCQGQWRGGPGAGRGGWMMGAGNSAQAGAGGPACFYCGDPGHFARNCPRKPNAAFQRGRGSGQRGGGRGGRGPRFAGLNVLDDEQFYQEDVAAAPEQQQQQDGAQPQGN